MSSRLNLITFSKTKSMGKEWAVEITWRSPVSPLLANNQYVSTSEWKMEILKTIVCCRFKRKIEQNPLQKRQRIRDKLLSNNKDYLLDLKSLKDNMSSECEKGNNKCQHNTNNNIYFSNCSLCCNVLIKVIFSSTTCIFE